MKRTILNDVWAETTAGKLEILIHEMEEVVMNIHKDISFECDESIGVLSDLVQEAHEMGIFPEWIFFNEDTLDDLEETAHNIIDEGRKILLS